MNKTSQKFSVKLSAGIDGKSSSFLSHKDKMEWNSQTAEKHVQDYASRHEPMPGKNRVLDWRETPEGEPFTVFTVKCGAGVSTCLAKILPA